jgi:tyrosyl-tRNA synthetase
MSNRWKQRKIDRSTILGQHHKFSMQPVSDTIRQLQLGGAKLINPQELASKLEENRPLRIKLGVDPTAPDLHLGHSVGLSKLRQFQELGHQAILVIGDFTTMVGDPTGRSSTRPMLSHDEVMANAETYKTQALKILDPERTEIVFNGDWFAKMSLMEVIRLNSQVTLQQMLQREDFKTRIDEATPVFLHELQYPLMQGWDSVMIAADVELGGTDQLFNILVGRDLQKAHQQAQQVACILPILEGLDGVQKMSKSLGNYVALTEPASSMFGKVMSISDELMARYYQILFNEPVPPGHPMEAKKVLASKIVARFHDQAAARAARAEFDLRFAKRDLTAAELPVVSLKDFGEDLVSAVVAAFAQGFHITKSRAEARRLIEQGSVQWLGQKIIDPKVKPAFRQGDVLKLDKTRAVRLTE